MSLSDRPDIFTYTAYRKYLGDWFAWRKRQSAFSHRIFARRLGSKDPSVLSNIIKGHRTLVEARVPLFAKAMELEDDEADHFALLVRLQHAEPGEQHERAWGALVEHRVRSQGIEAHQVELLSNLYFSTITTLAECEGFQSDPAWIADHLRPKLDPAVVAKALELLVRLGWLARDGETLKPATRTLITDELVLDLASYGFHRDSARLANHALDHFHDNTVRAETGFFGTTIAIPESSFNELRRAVWKVLVDLAARVDEQWAGPRTKVIHLGIQMFPLSESTKSTDE